MTKGDPVTRAAFVELRLPVVAIKPEHRPRGSTGRRCRAIIDRR
jgi:hypothetical protein